MEDGIVPKYGNKLRVVFKEFPLSGIHEWALTELIAAQCTYQIDPSKYVDFRTAVYKNQESVTGDHARDMLLHLGAEAGVDNMKLAACIDSKATLFRASKPTPTKVMRSASPSTSFINGRTLIGAPPASEFYKLIDQAMRDPK